MEDIYKKLGFKYPEYVENPYGIRIYIGTKYQDDWSVLIPKKLAKMKCRYYNCDSDYAVYFVTEEDALEIAKMYTELAKQLKG